MKLRVPYFYKEFHCIADRCKDSCCIGWEIDIDEDTYEYYQEIEGAFGERLRKNMKSEEENCFRLKNRRCPFLNPKNLCDICIELGEEALCEVCTEYPRFTMEYGDVMEKSMALSCEEVGRLLFHTDHPFEIEEQVLADSSCYGWDEIASDMDAENVQFMDESVDTPEVFMEYEADDFYEDDEVSIEQIHAAETIRDTALQILCNRKKTIEKRIQIYLSYCEKAQHLYAAEEYQNIENLSIFDENCEKKPNFDSNYILARFQTFDALETLDEEWRVSYRNVKEKIQKEIMASTYLAHIKEFMREVREREYEYEQLLCYFTFRYFMRAVYDFDFLSKAKFAVVSFLMIRDFDLICYLDQNKSYSLENRIDIARIYSKEVEHSDDNVSALLEEMQFDDTYEIPHLVEQVDLCM